MIHSALESWAAHPDQKPEDLLVEAAGKQLETIKEDYRTTVGAPPSDVELDQFYEAVDLGREMITNYQARWGSPIPEKLTLISSEQTFLIDVPGTDAVMQGTLDGLLTDNKGMFYVLERKTYGARPRLDSLETNDQFLAYVWALSKLIGDDGEVGGIFYDGLWKRRLDNRHSLDQLFFRTLLLRPPDELETFERYLTSEVLDMVDPNVRIYLNRRWEGCYDCPFERLCSAESRGEDGAYIKRNNYKLASTATEGKDEDVPD